MDGTRQDTENARGRSPLPRAASTASFPRGSVRRLVVRLMTVSSRRPELPVASRGPAGSGTVSATRRHADPCRPDRRGTGLHAWWSPGFGPAPGSRDRLPAVTLAEVTRSLPFRPPTTSAKRPLCAGLWKSQASGAFVPHAAAARTPRGARPAACPSEGRPGSPGGHAQCRRPAGCALRGPRVLLGLTLAGCPWKSLLLSVTFGLLI